MFSGGKKYAPTLSLKTGRQGHCFILLLGFGTTHILDLTCSSFSFRACVAETHHHIRLPGIGRKTALRLVLHLLSKPEEEVSTFGRVFSTLKQDIKYCKVCHNISDTDTCAICANPKRDSSIICVVENVQDVLAVESTMQFYGLYHVLGGVISPMDGVGPQDLQINSLVERVQAGGIEEVILALSPTMEGDTTNFFISRKLQPLGVKLSVIARGVAVGNNLEYADEVSLGRSIQDRTPLK